MKRELMRTDDGDDLVSGPAPLTPKEEAFARCYGDPESPTYGNATKSAMAAGYPQPHNAGWRLRRRPKIIARLEEFQEVARAAAGRVLADLEHVRQKALEKGDLAVATRCSELQGKHLGMFFERSVLTLDEPAQREYDERLSVEASRLAKVLLEEEGDRILGLPVPGEPALEGKAPALPEPKPAPERKE